MTSNRVVWIDSVRFRHFLTITSGEVMVDVSCSDGYWFYWIDARSLSGRRWIGQAQCLRLGGAEREHWTALVVDQETGLGTAITDEKALVELVRDLAELLDALDRGEQPPAATPHLRLPPPTLIV